MTAILALSAAVVYGTADFFGGVASRRRSPMAVTLFAHVVGLALLIVALPLLPAASPDRSTCSTAGWPAPWAVAASSSSTGPCRAAP